MKRSLVILPAALALFAQSAWAHEGHGLGGIHWHATDAGLAIAFVIAVGVALWSGRK